MTMPFKCAVCGHSQPLPDQVRGRKFHCPGCKARLRHYEDDWFEVLENNSSGNRVMPAPESGEKAEETKSGETRKG